MTTTPAPEWKAAPPRKNMWQETFRSFKRNFKEWIPTALIFAVAMAAVGLFLAQGIQEMAPAFQHKGEKLHIPKGFGVAASVMVLLIWIQTFYYLIFFAQKDLPYGKAVMSVGRFFYVLGLQIVVILLCSLVIGVGSAGAAFLGFVGGKLLGSLFHLIAYCFYYYLLVRLLLVYPLSASAVKPVLENSWNLTRGNWWRLFLNYLLIMIVMFLTGIPLGILFAVYFAVIKNAPGLEMPGMMGLIVVMSAYFVFNVGLVTAFLVSAARILIDEKRQSDPSFLSPKQA